MTVIQTKDGNCVCCGAPADGPVLCVCHAFNDWQANEKHDLKCGHHKIELYLQPDRTTIAMGVPALESNDRYRNFR